MVKDFLDADEQMSQGDDTEGVIFKVPLSAPELQLPRVPPDKPNGPQNNNTRSHQSDHSTSIQLGFKDEVGPLAGVEIGETLQEPLRDPVRAQPNRVPPDIQDSLSKSRYIMSADQDLKDVNAYEHEERVDSSLLRLQPGQTDRDTSEVRYEAIPTAKAPRTQPNRHAPPWGAEQYRQGDASSCNTGESQRVRCRLPSFRNRRRVPRIENQPLPLSTRRHETALIVAVEGGIRNNSMIRGLHLCVVLPDLGQGLFVRDSAAMRWRWNRIPRKQLQHGLVVLLGRKQQRGTPRVLRWSGKWHARPPAQAHGVVLALLGKARNATMAYGPHNLSGVTFAIIDGYGERRYEATIMKRGQDTRRVSLQPPSPSAAPEDNQGNSSPSSDGQGQTFAKAVSSPNSTNKAPPQAPHNIIFIEVKATSPPQKPVFKTVKTATVQLCEALRIGRTAKICHLNKEQKMKSIDEFSSMNYHNAFQYFFVDDKNLHKLTYTTLKNGSSIVFIVKIATNRVFTARRIKEASAALFNSTQSGKTSQVSFELKESCMMEPTAVLSMMKGGITSRDALLNTEDFRAALIQTQTHLLVEQGDSLDEAKAEAERIWTKVTILITWEYPKGTTAELDALCVRWKFPKSAKRFMQVTLENTDVDKLQEVAALSNLKIALRVRFGRRLELVSEMAGPANCVDRLTQDINNTQYQGALRTRASIATVQNVDHPVMIPLLDDEGAPEGVKNQICLRGFLYLLTVSPGPNGLTRYLVQSVMTTSDSKLMFGIVNSKEQLAMAALLVEELIGFTFFEIIKKRDVIAAYNACVGWFGKAATKDSLRRTMHDGMAIVTVQAGGKASQQSEMDFLLEQGFELSMNDESEGEHIKYNPDNNSLGTVLPNGLDYWPEGKKLPFPTDTPAWDIYEDAKQAAAEPAEKEAEPAEMEDEQADDEEEGVHSPAKKKNKQGGVNDMDAETNLLELIEDN